MKPLRLFSFVIGMACLLTVSSVYGQATVTTARLLGKSDPLRDLPAKHPNPASSYRLKNKQFKVPNFGRQHPMPTPDKDKALPKGPDPLRVAGNPDNGIAIQPNLIIDGGDQISSGGVLPPDPVGDVSPDHFIQMINGSNGSLISIFDKEGNTAFGPYGSNILWEELNITGFGDPQVIWDAYASRWILAEFAPLGQTTLLVAVSETSDPLGSWYAYEFQTQSFPDYPKFAVWPDGIFVTTNEFFDYMPVYVLDKEALYDGEAEVDVQLVTGIPKFGDINAFQTLTPVEADGLNPPPPGSPHYVVRIHDDSWGFGADRLEVWSIQIDWDDPGNTAVTGPVEIPLAPFDAELCNDGDIFNCIPQMDGTLVSALQQVVMHRAPYRNFNAYESIVLNFSVDVNQSNQSGIRWVELRKTPGQPWSLFQEGTWAPDDQSRFMGSIAMDSGGNILLGYSVTGSQTLLSARFTGRLSGDPLGQMGGIEEFEIGTGQAINYFSRWGDYANMVVDPLDDQTFWFTGEYMKGPDLFGTTIMSARVERDSNDIGAVALTTPQNSGYLTAAEPVSVAVRNFGHLPQSNFEVSYRFENGPVVTETITDTLETDGVLIHTFLPAVDMTEIGEYEFLVYTSLAADSFHFNDTLRRVVRQLPRNDAAIAGIAGTESPVCDELFNGKIVLKNEGVDTLFSALVRYQINEGAVTELEWTGALAEGGKDLIPISSAEAVIGANSILAYSLLPNGFADENTSNDTLQRPFTMMPDGNPVQLRLLTDQYPSETSWELFDFNSGEMLYEGGPYDQPQTLHQENWCLAEGCYEFRIYDAYGDGLQSWGVDGNYEIVDEEGNVLAAIQNVNFGSEEVNYFCTPDFCAIEVTITVIDVTEPGAADGKIVLSSENGIPPYKYSINDGVTFTTIGFFPNLAEGTYPLIVRDKVNCQVDTTAVVGLEVSATGETGKPTARLTIQPNPAGQVALIRVEGMQGVTTLPFQVLDASGRIVHHNRLVAYDGVLLNYLSMTPFPSGTYFIRIIDERFTGVQQFIRQ